MGSPVNDEGQGDQHERERDLQRSPETGVALPAEAGGGDPEDHERGAGENLRSDEAGAEAERLQSSGWHHRQCGCESDRREARQETVENHLDRGVEHPEGGTLRQWRFGTWSVPGGRAIITSYGRVDG